MLLRILALLMLFSLSATTWAQETSGVVYRYEVTGHFGHPEESVTFTVGGTFSETGVSEMDHRIKDLMAGLMEDGFHPVSDATQIGDWSHSTDYSVLVETYDETVGYRWEPRQ